MEKEIYIKVKSDNKIFKTKQGNLDLKISDEILFENEHGQDIGIVTAEKSDDEAEYDEASITIIRKLTEKDKEKLTQLKKEALSTLDVCEEKIKKHGLAMDLLGAEFSYDERKLTFYFSAPTRVDFRSLVPDLASAFKKLIRLQQVSSRDKAKCVGGYGRCGQKLCCKRFLKNISDATMDMASEQNLSQMGPNRVMGSCGKLMCCLGYELDFYEKTKKKIPKIEDIIKTGEGRGVVVSQNIIKNKVIVELDDNKKLVEVDC